MSYNLWNFQDRWEERLTLIAEIIREEDPDVVGFQEVRERLFEPDTNELAVLQLLLPQYQFTFVVAMLHPDLTSEGLGVFVRDGLTFDTHTWRLPMLEDCPDANTRILMLTNFSFGVAVRFWNTHWSYVRECQVSNALASWAAQHEDGDGENNNDTARFFVGDFNAYVDYSLPTDFLTGKRSIDGERGDWADTWEKLYPDEEGFTFPAWPPRTTRADRVLFAGARVDEPGDIHRRGTEPDPISELWPSDHCALAADFFLG